MQSSIYHFSCKCSFQEDYHFPILPSGWLHRAEKFFIPHGRGKGGWRKLWSPASSFTVAAPSWKWERAQANVAAVALQWEYGYGFPEAVLQLWAHAVLQRWVEGGRGWKNSLLISVSTDPISPPNWILRCTSDLSTYRVFYLRQIKVILI